MSRCSRSSLLSATDLERPPGSVQGRQLRACYVNDSGAACRHTTFGPVYVCLPSHSVYASTSRTTLTTALIVA